MGPPTYFRLHPVRLLLLLLCRVNVTISLSRLSFFGTSPLRASARFDVGHPEPKSLHTHTQSYRSVSALITRGLLLLSTQERSLFRSLPASPVSQTARVRKKTIFLPVPLSFVEP